jgi:hypothetical protein
MLVGAVENQNQALLAQAVLAVVVKVDLEVVLML